MKNQNIRSFEREIEAEREIRIADNLEAQCQRLRKRCFTLTYCLVAVLLAAVASGYHYQKEMAKLRKEFPKQAAR